MILFIFLKIKGIIPTEIWRDRDGRDYLSAFFMYLLRPFIRIFGKSVRQGASTTIHCAISNEVLKQSGLYFEYVYFLKGSYLTAKNL